MSSSVALAMDIIARDKASKTLDVVGDKTEKTGKKFGGLGTAAKAGFAIAGVALFTFAKGSVKAFSESEESQARLSDAFRKFPKTADVSIDALRDYNSELAKKVAFDDDAIASGQSTLAQFGLTGKQIQKITPLLADYAKKTGVDLPTAATILGKATQGNAKALKGVGLNLKDTGDAGKNFTQVMDGLSTKVGGFAENQGKTAAGQTEILKNQFGELQETVGAKLLPVMVKVVATGSKMVDWISKNQKVIVPLVAVIGTIIAAVKIWTIAQTALNFVLTANPIGLVIVGLVALGVGLVAAWKSSQTFRDVVKGVFKAVGDAASHLWDKVLRPYFKFITNAWLTVAGVFVHGAAKAFGWVPGIGGDLKKAAAAFETFKDKVNASLDGIKKDVSVNVKANFFGGSGGPGRVNAGLRAEGGPVTRGKPYIVGEVEPELFVPPTSGRILNQRQMRNAGAGSGGDTYIFNLPPSGDPLQHARQIETELTRLRRQRGTALAFT